MKLFLRDAADDILLVLDKTHASLLTLLDPSTAFDTINRIILLNRLSNFNGIFRTCPS